jgi:hypothetical protein
MVRKELEKHDRILLKYGIICALMLTFDDEIIVGRPRRLKIYVYSERFTSQAKHVVLAQLVSADGSAIYFMS